MSWKFPRKTQFLTLCDVENEKNSIIYRKLGSRRPPSPFGRTAHRRTWLPIVVLPKRYIFSASGLPVGAALNQLGVQFSVYFAELTEAATCSLRSPLWRSLSGKPHPVRQTGKNFEIDRELGLPID